MFKKISLLAGAMIVIISASLLITCKKSSDNTTTTVTPTCSDGIQNQGETGVDCGGPCGACPASITATINGKAWSAKTMDVYKGSSFILKAGSAGSASSNPKDSIWIGFATGSFPINSNLSPSAVTKVVVDVASGGSGVFVGCTGTLRFTDTLNKKVSGSFTLNGAGVTVVSGTFSNVPFH